MPSKSSRTRTDGAVVSNGPGQAPRTNRKPRNTDGPPRNVNGGNQPRRKKPAPVDEEDKLSDISAGDGYDDVEDQPRFKYSTAELNDGACRGNNCCILSAGIICIIVAVALSIVMVRVFKDKDEDNQAPAPTMMPTTLEQANQPGITLFQGGKAFIESECDDDNANSDGCEAACAGFECCDPTLAKDESCFFFNQQGCLDYQRCHVVSSGVDVPVFNLETVCSPQQISSDRTACENACASVKCCWESEVTCYDRFYTCMDYAPCQNLKSESTVPVARSDLPDFCDPTQTGSVTQATACTDACQPAECCWSEEPSTNCFQENVFSCLTYSVCDKFNLPGAGDGITLAPASLRNDCGFAKINAGNTQDCEESCTNGACCEDTCFLDDPMACLAYEPCFACEITGDC